MTRFIAIRLLYLLVGWLVASLLIFFSLRILPGDVAQVIAGTESTPEQVAALRESLGLNRSPLIQYTDWVAGVVRFDLGASAVTGSPVSEQIAQKMQVTAPLTLLSLLFGTAIAFTVGTFSALRYGRSSGQILSGAALLVSAIPVVWAGMLLTILLANWLDWLPSQGFPSAGWADPAVAFTALVLPALTIGLVEGAVLLRFVRSSALAALDSGHVRTAMARGMTRSTALVMRGMPSVGLSVISLLGLQIAGLLVGAVIIEQLFNLPGVGRMLIDAVGNRDLPAVQSILLVLTMIILGVGTVVDIAHRLIDPRLRTETK